MNNARFVLADVLAALALIWTLISRKILSAIGTMVAGFGPNSSYMLGMEVAVSLALLAVLALLWGRQIDVPGPLRRIAERFAGNKAVLLAAVVSFAFYVIPVYTNGTCWAIGRGDCWTFFSPTKNPYTYGQMGSAGFIVGALLFVAYWTRNGSITAGVSRAARIVCPAILGFMLMIFLFDPPDTYSQVAMFIYYPIAGSSAAPFTSFPVVSNIVFATLSAGIIAGLVISKTRPPARLLLVLGVVVLLMASVLSTQAYSFTSVVSSPSTVTQTNNYNGHKGADGFTYTITYHGANYSYFVWDKTDYHGFFCYYRLVLFVPTCEPVAPWYGLTG